jgi:hypothetical protein
MSEKEKIYLGTWRGMMHSSNPEFKRREKIYERIMFGLIGFFVIFILIPGLFLLFTGKI